MSGRKVMTRMIGGVEHTGTKRDLDIREAAHAFFRKTVEFTARDGVTRTGVVAYTHPVANWESKRLVTVPGITVEAEGRTYTVRAKDARVI